jgi:hypothetical protein
MNRLSSLVVGALCAMIALGPTALHAQEYPPPPPGYPPPPPPPGYPPPPPEGYPPPPPPGYAPPPNYYAPPPPQYYAPPPPKPPSSGVGDLIVGCIFLPLGVIFIGSSVVLWNDCERGGPGCFDSRNVFFGEAVGAIVLDIFGSAMFVVGAIEIPVGIVKMSKYSRWKREHQGQPGGPPPPQAGLFNLGHGVTMTPTFSSSSSGGTGGFKFRF